MAIVFCGTTRCAICENVIGVGEHWVAFPHFIGPNHDLWRYSDSAMHAVCFEAWPERERFTRLLAHPEERPGLDRETTRRLIEERLPGAYWRESPPFPTPAENRAHNEQHSRIMARIREHGGTCPHCGTQSTSYRLLNETDRARLVCLACARSCNATELVLDPSWIVRSEGSRGPA